MRRDSLPIEDCDPIGKAPRSSILTSCWPLELLFADPPRRRATLKNPRKIIVYIATSADGYIARPDGDVAWLDRPRPKDNYGMSAFFKSIDTILWGRQTYDWALAYHRKKGRKGG